MFIGGDEGPSIQGDLNDRVEISSFVVEGISHLLSVKPDQFIDHLFDGISRDLQFHLLFPDDIRNHGKP